MAEDKQFTNGEAEGLPPAGALTPAEALALAGRAEAAARRPLPLPWWYGPGVGLSIAAYGAAIGQSFEHQAQWLILLCPLGLVLVQAAIVRATTHARGVARLAERGLPPYTMRAFGVVVLAAALSGLAAWLATGDQSWIGAAAGAGGGLALCGGIVLLNRHLKEQSMSSAQ
ncbi:hypothetical protein [Kitasatospora cheerisanensis]|uniref:Uncharacterized protein n=1 Tax=Kitasatospora cheerisanensis KCTC 2395 TaxID=1348663 RepID=A0A066Z515_9ACTN|nr:hypothetical protein [Kitasatospora cheerisanensis]KDN85436.1 hypothetical protein KCH_26670 [Kitasatospora cheerisanensis KCTC 2395]